MLDDTKAVQSIDCLVDADGVRSDSSRLCATPGSLVVPGDGISSFSRQQIHTKNQGLMKVEKLKGSLQDRGGH
jgi:hypothetical protein